MDRSTMSISVIDQAERIASIESYVKNTEESQSFFYTGKFLSLPVIRIPINLPIYRVENGRTRVEQIHYIQQNNLPLDFFKNGQENESVQMVQQDILLAMSKDNKGPIYQELEAVKMQTERLLITSTGVVVNGNRRLAAMRALYFKNPKDYASFGHIDVIVLPKNSTNSTIEKIEAQLQLAPETKLPYEWIPRRLSIRHSLEVTKIPIEEIKEMYRFEREEEMNVELQQLALAEEYLDQYLGKPFAYKEVANSFQLFKEIQKALSGKGGEDAEVRRLVAFLLVRESRKLGNRAYDYRDMYGKDFDKVMQRFAEDRGIKLNAQSVIDIDKLDDDPLSGLEFEAPSSYAPLKSILKDPENSEELTQKLIEILEDVKQDKNDAKAKQAGLKNAQNALRLLNRIDITACDPSTLTQIVGQLTAINEKTNSLISEIKRKYN